MLNQKLRLSKSLTKFFKVTEAWIFDESFNKTGTIKDRKTEFILKKVKSQKIKNLVIISSGNAIYSLKYFAPKSLRVFCLFDKRFSPYTKKLIKDWTYKSIELDLWEREYGSQDLFRLFNIDPNDSIDCTNGYSAAYEQIASEIKKIMPDFVIVPFGSGETYYGVAQGIKKQKMKCKVIGVMPLKRNKSIADKLNCIFTPYKIKVINENQAKIIKVSEVEIKNALRLGKKKMVCEASSAIVFAIRNKIQFPQHARIVFLNTGRGKY